MANENVSININSKADLKGFKQAESAASKLNKTVKGLAATLGVAYGARAVTNFGKAAVKAFTDDQKSAIKLSIAVKNLGLSFQEANVEAFISSLEKSASIADDLLRPALQALLTTTGDFAKSQELLKTAVNVSRGSGEELITVANDLAQAYVGNTKGLKKYYLGLSQAQLKTMSFVEIQDKLNKQFKGASKAYLETYAGKMEALTTAAGRAQETIGGALVDAIISFSGAGDIQGVVDKIDKIAESGAKAISVLDVLAQASYFAAFKTTPAEFFGLDFGKGADRFAKMIEEQRRAMQYAGVSPFNPNDNALTGYKVSAAKEAKAKADAAKNAKLQAALQKKQTDELKKQALLKKAGSIFDLEQIQLIAALKGKLSDEERKRVELQFAILTGNTAEAQKLTYELARAQGLSVAIAKDLASLDFKNNPFASWEAYLDKLLKKAQEAATIGTGGAGTVSTSSLPPMTAQDRARLLAPIGAGASTIGEYINQYVDVPASNVAPIPAPNFSTIGRLAYPMSSGASTIGDYLNVVVQIDGKTIASAMQDQSLSGNNTTINRTGG